MEFAETRLTSPNPSSPNFAEEHLSSGPTIADAFSIVLDSTLSGIHQELPDSSSSNVKNDFILKADSSFAVNSTSSRKSEKSQSQTQNLILLMDQLDPMLSWDLIAQKIHSKYSIFEELIERTKAKLPCQNDPVQFFQLLLCQVDELLGQLKQMIQECCYAKADQEEHFSTSSQHYLQLTDSQSMYLFGNNCMTLNLKNLNELPEKYKVKIFNHSPGENTKNEDSNLNTEENVKEKNDGRKLSQNNKKKRSRQKFSQCDKCYKSWNDVRSYELHLKEPGKCPGKPWFKLLPGKKYSCIHPMCGGAYLEFQDQSNYWNHVRERHWVEEDLVINCPHCREKFPLLEMMKFHVKFSHPKTVRISCERKLKESKISYFLLFRKCVDFVVRFLLPKMILQNTNVPILVRNLLLVTSVPFAPQPLEHYEDTLNDATRIPICIEHLFATNAKRASFQLLT